MRGDDKTFAGESAKLAIPGTGANLIATADREGTNGRQINACMIAFIKDEGLHNSPNELVSALACTAPFERPIRPLFRQHFFDYNIHKVISVPVLTPSY